MIAQRRGETNGFMNGAIRFWYSQRSPSRRDRRLRLVILSRPARRPHRGIAVRKSLVIAGFPPRICCIEACRSGDTMSVRNAIWRQLEPHANERRGLSIANKIIVGLILFSSLVAIFETEPSIYARAPRAFGYFETVIGSVFAVEYVVRIWIAKETRRFVGSWGR